MKKEYKVFISSPSDLYNERKIIKDIITSYHDDEITLKSILWENDLPTVSGIKAQELVDGELLSKSDLLIGLFSSKFGSPTEEYESGTVEEIEIFINSGKPVILYFITDKDTRKVTELSQEDLEDLKKIKQFKEKYSKKGIYKDISIDDLYTQLSKDLIYNINRYKKKAKNINVNKSNLFTMKSKNDVSSDEKYGGNWWADGSITELINEYLTNKGLGVEYRGDLTFYENVQMIKDVANFTESTNTNILQQSKAYAFNKKYGNFDYDKDLRDMFPNWSKKIREKINQFIVKDRYNVLGIGSNYGCELEEIFGISPNINCTVLDISKDALIRGQSIYPNMEFIEGDMEMTYPVTKKYDICLCLRTIQSRGAFRQNVIIQMDKVLSKNGLILISIPNGYIDENKSEIVRGLYDHRNKVMQERRAQVIANKVLNKLQDYNYIDTGIETIETEILVWGIKS